MKLIFTLSKDSYISKFPVEDIAIHNRGGKGVKGSNFEDSDSPISVVSAENSDSILFLTKKGRAFKVKADQIESSENWKKTKAKHLDTILSGLSEDDKVVDILAISSDMLEKDDQYLFIASSKGVIKKVSVKEDISSFTSKGKRIMTFQEGDSYGSSCLGKESDFVCMTTCEGQLIKFLSSSLRPLGTAAQGVKGIRVSGGHSVVSVVAGGEKNNVLLASSSGLGKQVSMDSFRVSNRGGGGMRAQGLVDGAVTISAALVSEGKDSDVVVFTNTNKFARFKASQVALGGRSSRGVKVFSLDSEQTEKVVGFVVV